MPLTKKENSLLQDLKAEEQLCVEKYQKYANEACDEKLKNLFTQIGKTEQTHLETVQQILSGTVPPLPAAGKKPAKQAQPDYKSKASKQEKQQDAYLCSDTLGTEKHVSAVYDTSIFEFAQPQIRDMLNHIQAEEQHHGQQIYEYMAQNNMY